MADSQINATDANDTPIPLGAELVGGKVYPKQIMVSPTGTAIDFNTFYQAMVDSLATLITNQANGTQVSRMAAAANSWSYAAASGGIVSSTAGVTIKAAAGASKRNYITSVQVNAQALSAANEVVIRDGAGGTVLLRFPIPTGGIGNGVPTVLPVPIKGSANTLLEVALTSSTTGGVFVNVQGYSD